MTPDRPAGGTLTARVRTAATLLGVLVALAGPCGAQVASHCLPPEMPIALFPSWVSQLPEVESREVAPPLLHETLEARKINVADVEALLGISQEKAGKPDATTLADMCKEPREAVRLAQEGKYGQAAAAGDALLQQPRERYGDFTWDYLGNATAWSWVQLDNLKAAVQAHNTAAGRLSDPAVAQYHRLAASLLNDPAKSPRQLKDDAVVKAELQKLLADRVKSFSESAELAKKTRSDESRISQLQDAYGHLRAITATDPDLGKRLAATFRDSADSLIHDAVPILMQEARHVQNRLVAAIGQPVPESKFEDWNREVRNLWGRIRHIKRLCRMHQYLARVGLAGNADSARAFREAHRLLFAPDNPRLVWNIAGLRPVHFKDYSLRKPYQETLIKPM